MPLNENSNKNLYKVYLQLKTEIREDLEFVKADV